MITETTMKRGISATAKRAKISTSYMSEIANGKRIPGKKVAMKLRRIGYKIPAVSAAAKQ